MSIKTNKVTIENKILNDVQEPDKGLELPYGNPLDTLRILYPLIKHPILLHSARYDEFLGRYSILGVNPSHVLRHKEGISYEDEIPSPLDPFELLNKWQPLDKPRSLFDNGPPFTKGLLGTLAYELLVHLEDIPVSKLRDLDCDEMWFGWYEQVWVWDHLLQKCFAYGVDIDLIKALEKSTPLMVTKGAMSAKGTKETGYPNNNHPDLSNQWCLNSNLDRHSYCQGVEKTIDYIYQGDIFEGTLAQRFECHYPFKGDPLEAFALFERICTQNPAPFASYLDCGTYYILSASPERFIKGTQAHDSMDLEARPIKGTISRSKDKVQDAKLKASLSDSLKDKAENVMIVDLMRNDFSKICEPFSVEVPTLCGIESYETVHHMVSVIKGRLKAGLGVTDVLKACFPGGSITGAPKNRAMEIISELEPHVRGPYCGAIGYIGNGGFDLSITIRTMVLAPLLSDLECTSPLGTYKLVFHTGGAITLGSTPEGEYEESLLKANALIKILSEHLDII